MNRPIGLRLEQYTMKRPQEVLLVTAEIGTELDQIAIFKGFSSSLVRQTEFDPDIPVLPENAQIISIDRLHGPYNPATPHYLQKNLTLDQMLLLLEEVGV